MRSEQYLSKKSVKDFDWSNMNFKKILNNIVQILINLIHA
jgi:hypothetical protein